MKSVGRGSFRALLRVGVVGALVATGIGVPIGGASARSLFIIGCDETSDSDELAIAHAINAANDEHDHPGEDVIQLAAGCTYTLETPAVATPPRSALPYVDSTITVWGRGATIQGPTVGYGVDHLLWVTETGDLTLQDLTLSSNSVAVVLGGAAVSNLGYLALERVVVEDMTGGAVRASGPTTILSSTFRNNRVTNYHGAAISAHSSLVIQDSVFKDHFAFSDDIRTPAFGATIYLDSNAGALISRSTFDHGVTDRDAGAIFANGSLAVTESTFVNNRATYGAAAIEVNTGGDLTLTDSFFAQNDGGNGGGLLSYGSSSVTNSTFFDNSDGDHGGAIAAAQGTLAVTSSTFSSNTSTRGSGAIFQDVDVTGQTRFSVFDGHTSACTGIHAGEGNITDHYDPSCPGNFQIGDPELQPPAMNGGPTKTMRLGAGSYAAEHITSGCPSQDQRGYVRPSGAKCDAGAYEDQAPTAPGTPAVTAGGSPSKTGGLTLSWAASTDADDTVTYRVLHKDTDDSSYSLLGSTPATSLAFTEAEGTWSYLVESADGNHVASSGTRSVIVDKTVPLAPSVSPDRAPDYTPATGRSWYKDTVTVTTTSNGDPALADTSAGSGVASVTAPSTYSSSGTSTYTGTATDGAGNVSPLASLTVNVDAENPTVAFGTCPSTVLLKHAATAGWSASDTSSGLASASSGTFTLDTATIGHKSVSTTAADHVGHTATATCGYDVVYDFTGFFTPLVNAPAVYKASAGQNVPVAFSLAGNQGLGVFAPGYPQSVQTSCASFGQQTAGQSTTAVKPGLTYATGSGGRYNYVWKTSSTWRGTCRQLVVKLNDGTFHRVNVAFG